MGIPEKPHWCAIPRAEAPRTVLILNSPNQERREEDLSGRDHVILGRTVDSPGIVLRGGHTSRTHAAVYFTADGKAWIKDLGSVNGTHINNAKLTANTFYEWKPDVQIRFGNPPHHDEATIQRMAPFVRPRGVKRPREEEVGPRSLQLPKARSIQSSSVGGSMASSGDGAGAASSEATDGRAQASSQPAFIGPQPPPKELPVQGPQPPPKGLPAQGPAPPPGGQRARLSLPAAGGRGVEAAANGAGPARQAAKCDKCDGPHATNACPHFKKPREEHKDAWANYGAKRPLHMGSEGGNFVLRNARTIKQPGDGSCLFHSLCYGLSRSGVGTYQAQYLRREIASFIEENPHLEISGDTLEEWIRWDANTSSTAYARRIAVSGWGGGIEMAACSRLKNVSVHVYEPIRSGGGYRRISCFDNPQAKSTVHVLYQGGVHYDALLPAR